MRAALGAGRGRLMGPVLTESFVLALVGGVAGVGLAAAATRLVTRLDPSNLPRVDGIGVDLGVVVFTGAVAIVTGLLFGLGPALQASRPDNVAGSGGTRFDRTPSSARWRWWWASSPWHSFSYRERAC